MRNRADLLDPSDATLDVRRARKRLSRDEVYARRVSPSPSTNPCRAPPPWIVAAFDELDVDAAGAATACANHVAEDEYVVASFDVIP